MSYTTNDVDEDDRFVADAMDNKDDESDQEEIEITEYPVWTTSYKQS